MADLTIVHPDTGNVIKQVSVQGATSMSYATFYVAEALNLSPRDYKFWLAYFPELTPVCPDDIAADYEGKKLCLCGEVR